MAAGRSFRTDRFCRSIRLTGRGDPNGSSVGVGTCQDRSLAMQSSIARTNRKAAGFTFVEILASMLFLTILIPTVLGALAISNRASVVSQRSAVAMQLAENRLNELLAEGTWMTGGTG